MSEEPLSLRHLLLVGSGSIAVAMLPFWLNWMRATHPETEVRVLVTRGAERFVSRDVLTSLSGSHVPADEWPREPSSRPSHVTFAEWPDAVAVYPASLNYTAKLALGLGGSPSLLALQCTHVPLGVALSPPPGALTVGSALTRNVEALEARPNVHVVLPESPSRTRGRGENDAGVAPLPKLLKALDTMHRRRRDEEEVADDG